MHKQLVFPIPHYLLNNKIQLFIFYVYKTDSKKWYKSINRLKYQNFISGQCLETSLLVTNCLKGCYVLKNFVTVVISDRIVLFVSFEYFRFPLTDCFVVDYIHFFFVKEIILFATQLWIGLKIIYKTHTFNSYSTHGVSISAIDFQLEYDFHQRSSNWIVI